MKIKFKELKKPLFGRYSGIVIIPYVFIYTSNKTKEQVEILKNHEMIHVAQVNEEIEKWGSVLGWIIWYSKYLGFYFKNVFGGYFSTKGMSSRQAYMEIPYEKEAYSNEKDLDYLKNRNKFAWKKYR